MIDAVIFDLDGTIVEQLLDFDAIRAEIGLPVGKPILETISDLPPAERRRAQGILVRHEERAADRARLMPGARGIFKYLAERGLPVAILTRNMRRSVETILRRFDLHVDCVVAREDSAPKPHPDGVHRIARALGVEPSRCVMVGDYLFDIEAGRAAGARTVLMKRPGKQSWKADPHHVVVSLDELLSVLEGLLEQ